MVAGRAVAAAGCSHCRTHVLRLFTTPSISSTLTRTAPLLRRRNGLLTSPPPSIAPTTLRSLSSLPNTNSPPSDKDAVEEHLEETDELASNEDGAKTQEANVKEDTPWYLRVEPPRHMASMEPPPLPDVPSDAPAIIGSLVEYASEEMGLDELSLLDLRQLDPPPALGPNLFMLFGTARSERHLNVSAGRLLRYLRAKHRIWADADGLLGPNERKTKMRRKNKRAKLLGTMGTDDADDGIKTGWICVNLGTIGRGGHESAVISDDGRVSGFGVSQPGFTVVVQIMTEARRAEMGLETLWGKALKSPITEPSQPEAETTKPEHPLEEAIASSSIGPSTSQSRQNGYPARNSPPSQARFYSSQRNVSPDTVDLGAILNTSSREMLGQKLAYGVHEKQHLLQLLRARLDTLSPPQARTALGEVGHDQMSTPFLQLFELALRNLPAERTWEYRLSVQAKARESGHGGSHESLNDIRRLIEEMRIYGIQATREQYLQLLSCIYCTSKVELSEQSRLADDLLGLMHQRGQPVVANDILVTIIDAATLSGSRKAQSLLPLIQRLEKLMLQARLPCMDEPLLLRLMGAYARQGNWDGVWRTWRIPPRYLRPRSADMYTHIYRLAASTGSSAVCTTILRRCVQEMPGENPPVQPAGKVLQALMECIRVADPRAEELADSLSLDVQGHGKRLANREFVRLVRSLKILA